MFEAAPVHFHLPGIEPSILETLVAAGVDLHWPVFCNGPEAWCLQTYVHLKRRGVDVSCSESFERDTINIAHVSSLKPFSFPSDTYVVGVRADYRCHPLAQVHIVQNATQAGPTSFLVPHWPQPGMIPRDPERQEVRCVAYAGRGYYLAGRREEWEKECRRLGLEFRRLGPSDWHDFSGVDIAVAVRSFDHYPYDRKPPTKLLNAWFADVPLVAGDESAYRQVGTPGEDYLIATSFAEAMSHIERLSTQRPAYCELVQNGRERRRAYTRDAICDAWLRILQEEIVPRFRGWEKTRHRNTVRWLVSNCRGVCRNTLRQARTRLLGRTGFER